MNVRSDVVHGLEIDMMIVEIVLQRKSKLWRIGCMNCFVQENFRLLFKVVMNNDAILISKSYKLIAY
jgi:hypothetical protein